MTTKLHSYIGELISFQCKHRYVGTIVYHKMCDLLNALSSIIGQGKNVWKRKERIIYEQWRWSFSITKNEVLVS